jgi:hypothetical protein
MGNPTAEGLKRRPARPSILSLAKKRSLQKSAQHDLDSARGFMLGSDEQYAVLALDERDFGPHNRHHLSISLTMAFLLSSHLRFYLPMSDDVSREVDRAFDQVLKDLPMESKGIAYRKDLLRDGKICLIEGAKLVITSDQQIQEKMVAVSSPSIFLDFKSGRSQFIRWRFLENLQDDALKQQIISYSKLINAVSHIFHERDRIETTLVKQLSKGHTI